MMIDIKTLEKIPLDDKTMYVLAHVAYQHCGDRQIVTWIKSANFERVLKKYFGLSVAFGISMRKESCNGSTIKYIDELSVDKHYLVALDRNFDDSTLKILKTKGFADIVDCIFYRHKPVVLENFAIPDGGYVDIYGNTIKGPLGAKLNKVVLFGCCNTVEIGTNVVGLNNISISLTSKMELKIGNGCNFRSFVRFEVFGYIGGAIIDIGQNCLFTDALFRLYVDPNISSVVIGSDTTFETHFEAHANRGKKIIIGNDCMFSHNVYLLSGDGHAIFDVNSGKNINSMYQAASFSRNSIVIGNHVWVGYGAFILHGTNVGAGSIVGAQSVVKGIYPNNCAIGGNPAKLIRKDCAWARNMDAYSIDDCGKEYVHKTLEEPILDHVLLNKINNKESLNDKANSDLRTNGEICFIGFDNKTEWEHNGKTMLALDSNLCTGCSSCYNACPKDAINMYEDANGFIYPRIDKTKCVVCGICKNTCPKLNLKFTNDVATICYAFMADDVVRMDSASGGAFSACAQSIISLGGVVCGAAWSDDFGLTHIVVEKGEDLDKIRGSKYVQSSIGKIYKTIKKYLDADRWVLFVGTPCQVDGLLHYNNKNYDKLLTIDLLCRGVPSSGLFKRYLRESYGNQMPKRIVQKTKKYAGWGAYTEIEESNGNIQYFSMENNIWMKAFLSDLMFRDSCYVCPYPQTRRVGDLSIGDFWQIAKFDKAYDDKKGTSIVIANTTKGRDFLRSVKAKLIEEVPLSFEQPFNSALTSARKKPLRRQTFFDMLSKVPLGAAMDRALYGKKYDIGIVGWWSNLNYGGTLTYFALNKAVQALGYSVMMIQPPRSDGSLPAMDTVPMRFAKKHYVISHVYSHRDMHLLNYACKGFISGSDQLWNPWLEQYAGKECFLSFANSNSLRLSYASSYGNVSSFPNEFIEKYKPELKKFDAVSVREDYAVALSKKYFGIDAEFVCDPVFLCKKDIYLELASQSSCGFPARFTLNFILDPTDSKSKAIMYVSRKRNVEYVCFTDLQNTEQKKDAFRLPNIYASHAVEDLLKAYAQCDFVVTDSFHGTCFAIIFNKPFISIANKERGARRFESLLRWTGLSNRLVDSVEMIYNDPKLLEPIDYDPVNERVKNFSDKSLVWLKKALQKMKY